MPGQRAGSLDVPSVIACTGTASQKNELMIHIARLSSLEGQAMDPQNRILLEQSHLALADAAAVVGSLAETRTGPCFPLVA